MALLQEASFTMHLFLLFSIVLLLTATSITNAEIQPTTPYGNDSELSGENGMVETYNSDNTNLSLLIEHAPKLDIVGKLRKKRSDVLAVLGAVSSVITIFDFVFNKIWGATTSGSESYHAELQQITSQLNSIKDQVFNTIKEIKIDGMNTRISPHEVQIRNSLREADAYLKYKTKDRKKKFLNGFERLEESIFNIFEQLTTPSLTERQSILEKLKEYYDEKEDVPSSPRKEFIKHANSFMTLLAVGTVPLALAYHMKNIGKIERNGQRDKLREHEIAAIKMIRKLEAQFQDESRVTNQIANKMTNEALGKDNAQVARLLFNYLSKMYDTVNWAVIVYDTSGKIEDTSYLEDFKYIFRARELPWKNVVAFSSDEVGYCPQYVVEASVRGYCDAMKPGMLYPAMRIYSNQAWVEYSAKNCDLQQPKEANDELRKFETIDTTRVHFAFIPNKAKPIIVTSNGFCYTFIDKRFSFSFIGLIDIYVDFSAFIFPSNLNFRRKLEPSLGEYFRIQSQMNGRVLTRDPSTNTVAMMEVNPDDDNQLWYTDVIRYKNSIRSKNYDYCLKSLGQYFWTVTTAPCQGKNDEMWVYREKSAEITMKDDPQYCLDILHHNRNNDAPVIQYFCTGNSNQKWDLISNIDPYIKPSMH